MHYARRHQMKADVWLLGYDWWDRCKELRAPNGQPLFFQWADGTYDVIQHKSYLFGIPVRLHPGAGVPRLLPRG